MNRTIWKYPAGPARRWTVLMPAGAKILSVQNQYNEAQIWALVDPSGLVPLEAREFIIFGTGDPLPENPGEFIGTFQLDEGALIFHLFDCT